MQYAIVNEKGKQIGLIDGKLNLQTKSKALREAIAEIKKQGLFEIYCEEESYKGSVYHIQKGKKAKPGEKRFLDLLEERLAGFRFYLEKKG